MSWTPDRVERLKALAAQDLSSEQIADALQVSRSTVIGKLRRLGVALYNAGRRGCIGLRRAAVAGGGRPRGKRMAEAAQRRAQFALVEVVDLPPEQSATAVTLLELDAARCRWPLGDPRDLSALRFCGALPLAARPYCARHCGMAYVGLGGERG